MSARRHNLTMEVAEGVFPGPGAEDGYRGFRAVCSCGNYVSPWKSTNACMGYGRRHVAAMRKAQVGGAS